MSEQSGKPVEASVFGLPQGRFGAAVDVLAELQDKGEAILFFNRVPSLSVVVDADLFHRELVAKSGEPDLDTDEASEALEEVKLLSGLLLRSANIDRAINFLERDHVNQRSASAVEQNLFRSQYRAKLERLDPRLLLPSVKGRIARLESATVPCLEEVDYELVRERRDNQNNVEIRSSFIRVRLRYSDEQPLSFFFPIFSHRQNNSSSKSFELECDLADLDLMLKRLGEAKGLLIKSATSGSEG